MERKINLEQYALIFAGIIYSVGVLGHIIPGQRELMLALTPYTLLITGGVILYAALPLLTKGTLQWMLFAYVLTFLLEVVGVRTGSIFGHYYYSEILGTHLFDVPPVIGFNWVIIITGCLIASYTLYDNFFAKKLKNKNGHLVIVPLLSGFLAVLFDFFLEPIAINLGYWVWSAGVIPFKNYAAWFLIGYLLSAAAAIFKIRPNATVILWYACIQFGFFILLGVFL